MEKIVNHLEQQEQGKVLLEAMLETVLIFGESKEEKTIIAIVLTGIAEQLGNVEIKKNLEDLLDPHLSHLSEDKNIKKLTEIIVHYDEHYHGCNDYNLYLKIKHNHYLEMENVVAGVLDILGAHKTRMSLAALAHFLSHVFDKMELGNLSNDVLIATGSLLVNLLQLSFRIPEIPAFL